MKKLIFAFASDGSSPETFILVESIRKFAGVFSDAPIWLMTTKSEEEIPIKDRTQLKMFDVKIIQFELDSEILSFPFTGSTYAAATAESLAKGQTEFLVWLGTNSLIINEPKDFLLEDGKNLGGRPVHHTLIGSLYYQPIDRFWELIYSKCEVPEDRIFPMQTHVDGNILRPYFNSGFLIVRPEKGFLETWWKRYMELYKNPDFKSFYDKEELYVTFIHQAVLSAVILSNFEKEELQILPFSYCYPINLYEESLPEYRPKSTSELVTARYYLEKLLTQEGFDKIPFHEPFKRWLRRKLKVQ
ncbi:MAG: hypothetical protein H7641_04315 [Candidatus Heimdallarchaeota archaeon]|nr:hypothetical protein [Candidatus Heimdallarchaeota archaeon]MCK4876786.1 hypothetical protein [Candidatus Heimdallarchaeota archaeon]